MLETTISGRAVSFYESIKQLPALQYQKAKAYEILDAELPGSEADIEAGLLKLKQFQRAGQTESFDQLLSNLLLGRQLILTNYNAKQLEWATYIHSLDNVVLTDFSESNLERLVAELNPAQGDIEAILETVKKNSRPN